VRLREPAAWVALGVLVLNLVLAVLQLATFEGPLVNMGWLVSDRVANPMPLLATVVLVSLCVLRERTPHARQLTLISLVVGVIAVLFGLALALLGVGATAPILEVFAAIVPQAISIFAVVLLIKLLLLQAVPRRLPPGIGLVVPEYARSDPDQERADPSPSLPPQPAPDQALQPGWHMDAAEEAARPTAVDVAAGPPATGWGEAPTVRWHDIPTPTNGSRPDGRMVGDSVIHPTVPMPEQQPPGRPEHPSTDQKQWNSQPLALDWSGSESLNRP
jgi:hypothetical protein